MECELRSIRQAAQSQERAIQGLTESISTKDNEVRVCLYCTLSCRLFEMALIPMIYSAQRPRSCTS